MPDYTKGKIYTIRCRTDDTLIYVGSTIQPLSVRLGGHKVRSNNVKYQNILLYKNKILIYNKTKKNKCRIILKERSILLDVELTIL